MDALTALNNAKSVYTEAQKAVTTAQTDLASKKKAYDDAVAARKPHEEALASAKTAADAETQKVSESEVAVNSIEDELATLQGS